MKAKEKNLIPSVDEKSQLVQMRIQPKTLRSIDNLTELTGTTNRTRLISSSIQLTEEIVKRIQAGAKVYIEGKDGQKELLTIVGL
jgi:hypothetical protein